MIILKDMKILLRKYILKLFPYVLIIIGTYYISAHFYQFALINGDSMQPTYHSMQIIILDKYTHEYNRGDTIAFYSKELDATLFKRIVALPGDTIQILNNTLYINKKSYSYYESLNSLNIDYDQIAYSGIAIDEVILNADSYFVLGDNLTQSKDSRYPSIGCINSHDIIGKVITSPQ